jgi:crotonobetainyl-CoA:carnitine CoA-transferase CaiB-like acyl-CoA transferase
MTNSATAPFAGLRVLDFAWAVAGPVIGRTLADFGATVVRVESSQRIETARMMGPFPEGKLDPQKSALYENCNAGKLGLTLDLARPEAREIVRDLVRDWADVVIESFSPGQMARWGLGYQELCQLKPDLLMVSTSLMGQSGPWASFAGFGNVGAAISGYQAIVGWPGAAPVGPFGPYTDFTGPRFALVALLAALDQHRRTGQGCWLDVSQAESGIQFQAPYIARCAATGESVAAQGNRDAQMAPHGVFPCIPVAPNEEGWVAIAVRSEREWQRTAELIGGAALRDDPRFATLALRQRNEDVLEAIVATWTQVRTAPQVEQALQAVGVPAHNVASADDLLADPQLQAREHYLRLPHGLMEHTVIENARYRLSTTPAAPIRAAPHFGRDNAYVLGELLGYDSARIAALGDAGILS